MLHYSFLCCKGWRDPKDELGSCFGPAYKPPSYNNIRPKLLKKKVVRTDKILEEHRTIWKKTGCTIMIDGWIDRRRIVLNFLGNSPKGNVFLRSIDASRVTKQLKEISRWWTFGVVEVCHLFVELEFQLFRWYENYLPSTLLSIAIVFVLNTQI